MCVNSVADPSDKIKRCKEIIDNMNEQLNKSLAPMIELQEQISSFSIRLQEQISSPSIKLQEQLNKSLAPMIKIHEQLSKSFPIIDPEILQSFMTILKKYNQYK